MAGPAALRPLTLTPDPPTPPHPASGCTKVSFSYELNKNGIMFILIFTVMLKGRGGQGRGGVARPAIAQRRRKELLKRCVELKGHQLTKSCQICSSIHVIH